MGTAAQSPGQVTGPATIQQCRLSTAARTAVLASADASFRERLRGALADLRWQVREARGGAEILACLEASPAEAVVLDSWLPDLEIQEFVADFRRLHPEVDLIMADASEAGGQVARGPRRNEVLHAIRRAQAGDEAIWNSAPDEPIRTRPKGRCILLDRCSLRTPKWLPVSEFRLNTGTRAGWPREPP